MYATALCFRALASLAFEFRAGLVSLMLRRGNAFTCRVKLDQSRLTTRGMGMALPWQCRAVPAESTQLQPPSLSNDLL